MDINRVKVSTIQQNPNASTTVNGLKENLQVKVSVHGQLEIDILDNAKMGCSRDMEHIIGMKGRFIKDIGMLGNSMKMVRIQIRKEIPGMEYGTMDKE